MRPTAEQVLAVDAFLTGDNATIEAGAGTGKTSTLKLMGVADPSRKGLYVAYNAAVARESAATFPPNIECRTAHSVAYRWTAGRWGSSLRDRLNAPRMSSRDVALVVGSMTPVALDKALMFSPHRVASIAMETVKRFCYTGDPDVAPRHVPDIMRVDTSEARARLVDAVVPLAKRAWADLSRQDGRLRLQHDHYLKLWALSDPQLAFDYVLVDEAQDSNGVVTDVVRKQTCQIVAVGDRCQAIYGWRGATDAMDAFGAKHKVYLTQSFRFGQAIADEANKWLEVLESELRLVGSPAMESRLEEAPNARAVLCRTNAAVMTTVLRSHAQGKRVALVGGGKDIVSFARAARQLMDDGFTAHPDLFPFTSWGMVKEYVSDAYDGSDLAVLVRLIDEHTPEGVIRAVEACVSEAEADVVVSTAHKAKGREWDSVRIADDFQEGEDVSDPEAMLAYVAITRAREVLDREGLAWIDGIVEPKAVRA